MAHARRFPRRSSRAFFNGRSSFSSHRRERIAGGTSATLCLGLAWGVLRILDEFLWALRRDGLAVAPSQAIDVARAAATIGFEEPSVLREAIASVVVSSSRDRARFDEIFGRFFAVGEAPELARDLWGRLRQQGFSETEIAEVRALLDAAVLEEREPVLAMLLSSGAERDSWFATAELQRILLPLSSPMQAGFYAHRLLDRLGFSRLGSVVVRLRELLAGALSEEQVEWFAEALLREAQALRGDIREHIHRRTERSLESGVASPSRKLAELPFDELSEAEAVKMRAAVRRFATRLKGVARLRERRAQRGRLDPHRTMRQSLRTGAIPFRPALKSRRRDKPRLVVLCDLSDSVRSAAGFMLELVYAMQELFERTRSFVFVSEIAEVTKLFQKERAHAALAHVYEGSLIDIAQSSNYERAFRAFDARFSEAVDKRATVIILGDGRTNYRPHGAEFLGRIRDRARRVLWLCPEPRENWGLADSAIPVYETKVERLFEARCVADLERAARQFFTPRLTHSPTRR